MRRLVLPLIALLLAALAWSAYWGWHHLLGPAVAEAQPLAVGQQEVAWIYPATSGDTWERLVAALRRLQQEWPEVRGNLPELHVSFDDAFLQQTAAVPQIALHFAGHDDAKLWIRWYKLSGETDHRAWLDKLKKRGQPPLAIIGGDTSDRALALARSLQETRQQWSGAAPLFLITTATADRYYPGDIQAAASLAQEDWPKLMHVYKERTFRFCFTNTRMAEAVLDFVQENPRIWPEYRGDAGTLAAGIAQAAAGHGLGSLGLLATAGPFRPILLYALAWTDDRYSQDLADRFSKVFIDSFYQGSAGNHCLNNYIDYSVGDFYQPTPSDQRTVGLYLQDYESYRFRDQRQLLAVPTGTQRARRFLRTLCRQAQQDVKDVIAISGDAITFNQIYRDREIAWNVLDVPVPLVFFSHRNPIDKTAGFGQLLQKSINTTGTQDVLLLRDIIEALVQANWAGDGWLTDSNSLRDQLEQTRWFQGRIANPHLHPAAAKGLPLFDEDGNRRSRRGEHVIWLQPSREGTRLLPEATISVWSLDPQSTATTWERVGEPLVVTYNQAHVEIAPDNGR